MTASSFRAPTCRVAEVMTEGGATEPSFDVGGTALQEVVAVNGLSILVMASSLSELKYSVEEDMTEGVAVDRAWAVVPSDGNKLECTIVLSCGGCDRGWRYR